MLNNQMKVIKKAATGALKGVYGMPSILYFKERLTCPFTNSADFMCWWGHATQSQAAVSSLNGAFETQ